jgi:GntR family transcriptional regulator/MocR family aminotransferase
MPRRAPRLLAEAIAVPRSKLRDTPAANVADLLRVDRTRPCTLTDQVCVAIRDAVAGGVLSAGMRMPSTRDLARLTGLARNTILNAYDELRRQGVLAARRGSATVIAASAPPPHVVSPRAARSPVRVADAREGPCTSSLSARSWQRAMLSSLSIVSKSGSETETLRPAREAIAQYLAVRGIRCGPDHVFLASTRRQAIDLALRSIAATSREVLIEDPGSVALQKLVLQDHLTPVPLPVDSLGANIAAALRDARDAHAAYVTPAHQDPLGIAMTSERRDALTAWAEIAKGWIIEDDTPATLRRKHAPSLYSSGGRTLHVGTFAYATAPMSAMSYLVVPDALIERTSELAGMIGTEVTAAEQLAMRQLILSRSYQRSLEAARVEAERRHAIVTLACERHLLWFAARVMGTETGERAVLWLQRPFDPVAIAEQLRAHQIPVDRLQQCAIAPVRDALVLRLDRVKTPHLEEMVRRIASIVRETHRESAAARDDAMLPGCLPKTEAPRLAGIRS